MKKPELLSPVGNKEALIAAINAGCDAVYLGGYTFGARNYARNFSDEELVEVINYAHIYGVKVYVTVNTIIYEEETERFIQYVDFLHQNNVDAIIIQDLGMMDYLRKVYPNLEIHASTQMNVHNVEGAKLLEELDVKRVVLTRETSIDVIREIKKNTNIEIEVFIQGALCFSYSGQCLMSSLIGGRSGNRGTCAQCCRMGYDLISNGKKVNEDRYLLSTKDLNTLEYISQLIEIGVDSLKIEGRMKRPEYVYLMTSIYRKALDDGIKNMDETLLNMKKIFHREFTKGFLFHEKNASFINQKRPNHLGIPIGKVIDINHPFVKIKLDSDLFQEDGIRILNAKEDVGCIVNKIYLNKKLVSSASKGDIIEISLKGKVNKGDIVLKTTDKRQMEELNQLIHIHKKIRIIGKAIIKKNEPIILTLDDGKNSVTIQSDYLVEEVLNHPTSKDRIIEQFKKLGNTPFVMDSFSIDYETSFVKISELNDLRRKAIQELINMRMYQIPYQKEAYQINLKDYPKENHYSIFIHHIEDYQLIKEKKFNTLYLESHLYNKIDDDRKVLRIPRVNFSLLEHNEKLLISDLGSLKKYQNVITDFPFNVTNSYTVAFLHSLGVDRVTLSYELTESQIETIIKKYEERYGKHPNLEVIVSSYPEVMISKFKLLSYFNVSEGYLKDQFNNHFRVKEQDNMTTIYHYQKLEQKKEECFKVGVNHVRIHIEDQDDIVKIP